MSDDKIFCTKITLPYLDDCMTMAEWGANWQAVGILVTLITIVGAVWKFWRELTQLRIQRSNDALLKRTEFFLAQHRLLFSDPILYDVLQYIDGDASELTDEPMWDKKRKFLTFIEEISLLTSSDLIKPSIAYYMFGYYAVSAKNGENFMVGINADRIHWQVFYEFCEKAEEFFERNSTDLSLDLKL
jgi:hypothetical protein